MLIDNLVSFILWWIFIGAVVWALSDPAHRYDVALRSFVQRRGRLPRKGVMLMATIGLIVAWPKLARMLWEEA